MSSIMKGRLDEFRKIGADAQSLRDIERFAAKAAEIAHAAAKELPFGASAQGFAREFAVLVEDGAKR